MAVRPGRHRVGLAQHGIHDEQPSLGGENNLQAGFRKIRLAGSIDADDLGARHRIVAMIGDVDFPRGGFAIRLPAPQPESPGEHHHPAIQRERGLAHPFALELGELVVGIGRQIMPPQVAGAATFRNIKIRLSRGMPHRRLRRYLLVDHRGERLVPGIKQPDRRRTAAAIAHAMRRFAGPAHQHAAAVGVDRWRVDIDVHDQGFPAPRIVQRDFEEPPAFVAGVVAQGPDNRTGAVRMDRHRPQSVGMMAMARHRPAMRRHRIQMPRPLAETAEVKLLPVGREHRLAVVRRMRGEPGRTATVDPDRPQVATPCEDDGLPVGRNRRLGWQSDRRLGCGGAKNGDA